MRSREYARLHRADRAPAFYRILRGRRPRRRSWPRMLIATNALASVIWIRLYVGAMFFFEGIQRFLYPDQLGASRFDEAGIPAAPTPKA